MGVGWSRGTLQNGATGLNLVLISYLGPITTFVKWGMKSFSNIPLVLLLQ